MSKSHIRKAAPPEPFVWWKPVLMLFALVALTGVWWAAINWSRSLPSNFITAKGRILELRRSVDGSVDSIYGGRIIYGAEARVLYAADGQSHEGWLRVSTGLPRDTLLLKLASHPSECVVYWPPDHPEDARCWLK
jgi:hypothetical protein